MTWEFKYFQEENFVKVTEEGLFSAEDYKKMLNDLVLQGCIDKLS